MADEKADITGLDFTGIPMSEKAVGVDELDFTGIPFVGEEPEVAELRAAPDKPGAEVEITDTEVFQKQMALFSDSMMKGVYGEENLAVMQQKQKELEFFISRTPRIALAFVSPVTSLAFEALDQGKSAIVSGLKGEEYDPIVDRALAELLPANTPAPLKIAASLGETLVDIAIVGGLINLAKDKLLTGAVKELGKNLTKLGYGEGKATVTKEAIREAAKGTTVEQAAGAYMKAKNPNLRAHFSRQIGDATAPTTPVVIKTPVTGAEVRVQPPSVIPLATEKSAVAPKVGVPVPGNLAEAQKMAGDIAIPFAQRASQLKSAAQEGKISITELGKLVSIMPPDTEVATTVPGQTELQNLVNRYDEGGIDTVNDLVAEVRGIDDPEIQAAVQEYDTAVSEDRFEFGMRSGLDEEYGEKLVSVLRNKAQKAVEPAIPVELPPPVQDLPPGETVEEVMSKVPKYKSPSYPGTLFTSQSRTAELLGLKPLTEPLEIGKMNLDVEYTTRAKEAKAFIKAYRAEKGGLSERELAIRINMEEKTPEGLDDKDKAIFEYYRTTSREMLERVNAVREVTGRKPIEGIDGYFRRVVAGTAKDVIEGKYPLPEDAKFLAMKNLNKQVFNPTEMQRKVEDELLEYFSADIEKSFLSMLRYGLREIHLAVPKWLIQSELNVTPIDQELYKMMTPEEKALYDAERNAMPEDTRRWLIDYVNTQIDGKQTSLDKGVDNIVNATALKPFLRSILGKFGKNLSDRPVTNMISSISRLPILGTMGGVNPRQLLRNKMQVVQNLALYGVNATVRGILPIDKESTLAKLKTDSLFRKTYQGYERVATTTRSKVEKLALAPFQKTAVSNVSQAMNAAFYWTANLIQNPKYKDLGWADPQRTGTEDPDFFYPSEEAKLLKEMEYGAQTTQYGYLAMHMPEIFRYKALAPITQLMSWPMNYWFMFGREQATRGITGHTGYDETLKIPNSERFNAFKYLIIGGIILNTLGYTRSYLIGTAPTAWPPVAQLMFGLAQYFTTTGDSDYAKMKRGEAERDIKNAAMTFIPGYLSIKDLMAFTSGEKDMSEYLFYKKSSGSDDPNIPQ